MHGSYAMVDYRIWLVRTFRMRHEVALTALKNINI
jgi:hypothetical protein